MDHSDNGHAEHGDIHLPDPSIWPLAVGVAALVLGAALIFYSRDRDAAFAGPLLGSAVVITLLAAFGWAYEDGRMKKKAEEGAAAAREARYTQVVTFAIPEGQYAAARASDGIINRLEDSNNKLRDLDGFQDMRVIASPSETGPSQVLVETTWADREGLATYEETRSTMLDLLSKDTDQVVSGSIQVFDMEVVRDTKEVAFRFGTGALVSTFGALIVGGFMVGAGLSLFQSENAGGGGGGGEPTAGPAGDTIVARNTKFISGSTIIAPPNMAITLKFDDRDASPPHNVEIFAGSSQGGPLLKGCTAGCADDGEEVHTALKGGVRIDTFTFTTPGVGEYFFDCVAHPTQMQGKLIIQEGAPVPGGAAAPAAAAP